ncbi:MAG TPA: hypothetical protein PKI14_01480 [Fervidobacterium sp.]|nr:hypothetical protein [Fervidobacterium sp.]
MSTKTIFIFLAVLFLQLAVNAQEVCTKTECPLDQEVIKKCNGHNCTTYSQKTHIVVRKASKCELEVALLKKKLKNLESENEQLAQSLNFVSAKLHAAQNKPAEKVVVVQEKLVFVARKLKKNNVTVLAGRGPVSIDGKLVGNKVEADLKHDAVGAIQYTRRFDYLSGTIQLQTNESILLGIGLEF